MKHTPHHCGTWPYFRPFRFSGGFRFFSAELARRAEYLAICRWPWRWGAAAAAFFSDCTSPSFTAPSCLGKYQILRPGLATMKHDGVRSRLGFGRRHVAPPSPGRRRPAPFRWSADSASIGLLLLGCSRDLRKPRQVLCAGALGSGSGHLGRVRAALVRSARICSRVEASNGRCCLRVPSGSAALFVVSHGTVCGSPGRIALCSCSVLVILCVCEI